ncbi:hypothetical protein [Staphylococcus epidermidis]|uniref:hypothetical protein n=1 Tax=Staphylococcus epidermidis TaxID=1282 RepID=UPI0011A03487|nr:hypothetical protein [Staphylococcus epidermidis]MBM0778818.1 hypothetical protein [Staphylococcus epidermidis]
MAKNTYNESMYQDYIGQQVIFYLFTEKRIIATIKEVRRFELLIERKVKNKNSGKTEQKKIILPKSAIIFAYLK